MSVVWIVVASHSQARIFEAKKLDGQLKALATLTHPEAELHDRDVISSAPGRQAGSGGERHAMTGKQDIKRHEGEKFSKEVAQWLERARQKHAYDKVYLIAEPSFLGTLREAMGPAARDTVAGEISKNLVAEPEQKLREHLGKLL